jgi:alpha-glucuronidase
MKVLLRPSLLEKFEEYSTMVYGGQLQPGSVQYQEIRRAFISGISTMFGLINNFAELEDDVAIEALKEVKRQLQEFAENEAKSHVEKDPE